MISIQATSQWLALNGGVLFAGFCLGAVTTFLGFARQLLKLQREGLI